MAKKSLHRAKLSGVAPHNGDELQTAEGKLAGTVVATAGELGEYQILAVINDKFVNDPLTLNGEMITELTASNS